MQNSANWGSLDDVQETNPGEENATPPAPDNSHGITKGGLAGTKTAWINGKQCARDDKKCDYFTYLEMSEDDLPWAEEEPWKGYEIEGLKDASEEWLELVFSAGAEGEESEAVEETAQEW